MRTRTDEYRWLVLYVVKSTGDDHDLMTGSKRAHFDSEEKAHEFAKRYEHKSKPWYWQPRIVRQRKYTIVTHSEDWIEE